MRLKNANGSSIGSTGLIYGQKNLEETGRLVWINIEGIPVEAWSDINLSKFAAPWGHQPIQESSAWISGSDPDDFTRNYTSSDDRADEEEKTSVPDTPKRRISGALLNRRKVRQMNKQLLDRPLTSKNNNSDISGTLKAAQLVFGDYSHQTIGGGHWDRVQSGSSRDVKFGEDFLEIALHKIISRKRNCQASANIQLVRSLWDSDDCEFCSSDAKGTPGDLIWV